MAEDRTYYQKNRDKILSRSGEWYRNNRDRAIATAKKNRAKDPAHANALDLASSQRRKFGITEEQYQVMVLCQGGSCEICGEHMPVPQIDHDHKTGALRGLLCGPCNRGIGHLRDSVDLVQSAAMYLERSYV